MGLGQIKTPQGNCSYRDSTVFLEKWSLDCCLFLVFRVLKKLSLTIFASFLFAFMEERIFNGPYSIIFADITGFYILIFIFFNSGILIGSLSNLLVFVSILPILFNNLFFVTLLLP